MRGQLSVVSGQGSGVRGQGPGVRGLCVLTTGYWLLATKLVAWSALFIPQTSQLTLQNAPLAKGEAAYVESETPGYAQIVVGGDNGKTLRVEDAATVHGYSYEYIPRTEVTIIQGAGISYNGATDKYTGGSAIGVYTLNVMVPPEYTIDALEYTAYAFYTDMVEIRNGDISHVINGNVATITMTREIADGEISVADIKVRRVLAGNVDVMNDLTKLEFSLKDDLGEYEWRQLRYWVTHLYDYNRGEDWSAYKAKCRASLDGKGLQLSANNRFAIDTAETQTVFRAANHDALVIKATGTGAGYLGAFDLQTVIPFDGGVYIPCAIDITGFDASQFVVQGTTNLTDCANGNWTTMTYTLATNVLTVTCSPQYRFFRAVYNGTVLDVAEVEVNVPLKVNSALYLKGEDSVIYQITVNGGVISATAIE